MNEELLGQVYFFVKEYTEENKVPPSRREIAKELEIGVATAQRYVEALAEEGLLSVRPNTARGVIVEPE